MALTRGHLRALNQVAGLSRDNNQEEGKIMSRAVVLAERPSGAPRVDNFRIVDEAERALADGELRIENHFLSLDPYMRPKLNEEVPYGEPLKLGDVIIGETVGVVSESRSALYQVGEVVCALSGWRTQYVTTDTDDSLIKVEDTELPLSVHLGAAGMPGRTAYFGLLKLGKPKAGDLLVVSAASGAVGSVVGQIGKLFGCRVVGVAGGPEKCRYVEQHYGFDRCLDYKNEGFAAALRAACRGGIDIYFENVGGAVTREVAGLLNHGARVPICGYISAYDNLSDAETPMDVFGALDDPPEHRFFLTPEWRKEFVGATRQLSAWVSEGKIRYSESIAEGIDNAPAAFIGMLRGENMGKQLVRLNVGSSK